MQTIFYVNFNDYVKLKIVASQSSFDTFNQYLPGLIQTTPIESNYTIISHNLLPEVVVPNEAKIVSAFAASDFSIWENNNIKYAYTEGNKFAAPHFVSRNNKNIDLYSNNDDGEILIKLTRELILKEMIKIGFVPFHASCVEKDEKCLVFFGSRNAGKTTSLLLHCAFLGYNPSSNDLTLIRKNGDNYEISGWFYKISFINKAINLIKREESNSENTAIKTKHYPTSFSKEIKRQWVWKGMLDKLINVQCDYFSKDYSFNAVQKTEQNQYTPYIFDDWNWGDYLQLGVNMPNIESTFNQIPIYKLSGNIALYAKELAIKQTLENSYFDSDFTLRPALLGTGDNFICKQNQKQFFIKMLPKNDIRINPIGEMAVYKKLKDSGIPIRSYKETKNGKYMVEKDNYFLTVLDWIDGDSVKMYDCDENFMYKSADYLGQIVSSIADLELPLRYYTLFDNIESSVASTNALLEQLEQKPHDEDYYKIKDALTWKISQLKNLSELPDKNKLTFANTHGDYSILQTIKRDGSLYKIIDFSNVGKYPIIWEILRSFSFADKDSKNCVINEEKLKTYIGHFEKHFKLSDYDKKHAFEVYYIQLLRSNYGFYNYINGDDKSELNFAFWRVNYAKALSEKIQEKHGEDSSKHN